ncbi:restriction endonuclease subunit S [Actinomyces stomatis]|uniref:restriction endonuclease subunit S n=1 Tax=Actinomyces stomatis TaxID=3050227 RepID=UPI0028528C6D|nr:restriction endonuclease subunit S [Actinomyces sp. PK606]
MSRIDDLIRDLCPDGVEYKSLGEVARYSPRKVSAEDLNSTTFVGVDNLVSHKKGRTDATHTPNTSTLTAYSPGSILLGNIRPYLKKIWLADRTGGCSGDVLAVEINDQHPKQLEPRFLYYVLSSDSFFTFDQQNARGAKMPRGNKKAILRYPVPVPPLEVQHETTRILDKFTQLEAELEAELEARQHQYNYYLDELLSFKGDSSIPWLPLSQLGTFHRGKRFVKTDYSDHGVPCIHYGEIYTRYGVSTSSVGSNLEESLRQKLRFAQPGDVILVDVGEVVDDVGRSVAWIGDEPVAIHDHSYAFRSTLNPTFVSYVMRTDWFRRQKAKHIARTKVKTLLLEGFSKIQIPTPPPVEQDRIVERLNQFDALVNDLTSGLPAEIEARRKQYEYYRDRLLTFPEKK